LEDRYEFNARRQDHLCTSCHHAAARGWRQKDLGEVTYKFEATVRPHGVVLVRINKRK